MSTKVINGAENGGKHVVDGPLTVPASKEGSPDLLQNEIDRRIVKIRPSATPVDQISRMAATRRAGAMKVEYYSVDTRPTQATVGADAELSGAAECAVTTDANDIFQTSETILLPETLNKKREPIVAYISGKADDGTLKIMAVNLGKGETVDLETGCKVVRMGRAATELDVQSPSFEALPVKADNYCQIFKTQIEESTLHRMTNKEVGWTFSDQEEAAVIDMRQGMEKSFLFGVKAVLSDPAKREDVMLTGGIWHQAASEFSYKSTDPADTGFIVDLTRKAFTGNAGSRRKVLIAGSGLIDRLNRVEHTKVIGAADSVTRWGIDFSELRSKFGVLYVVHSEIFDGCGMSGNGMVIDPQYLTKYSFIPMSAERLELKRSGLRNTDAVVITEASCLTLRYPKAHLRIVCTD